jgi:hypothetical protein
LDEKINNKNLLILAKTLLERKEKDVVCRKYFRV